MKLSALKEYLVEENGNVNFPKSLGKLEADLLEYDRISKKNRAIVESGIDTLFDKYRGASISMHALINLALPPSGSVTPDQWVMLEQTLIKYMSANSGDCGRAKFGKAGGKGYWRWSDHPQMHRTR